MIILYIVLWNKFEKQTNIADTSSGRTNLMGNVYDPLETVSYLTWGGQPGKTFLGWEWLWKPKWEQFASKLVYYLPYRLIKKFWNIFKEKPKKSIFRGLGDMKTKMRFICIKTSILPTIKIVLKSKNLLDKPIPDLGGRAGRGVKMAPPQYEGEPLG